MRRALLLSVGAVLLVFFVGACQKNLQPQVDQLTADKASLQQQVDQLKKQNQALTDLAGPLPTSLDNLNPPKAQGPLYLLAMLDMVGPMEGIFVDLQEQDIPGVQANFQAFKEKYAKVAEMVPEWKGRFPMAPVDALGQALASGDPAKVGAAMGALGGSCTTCHLANQTKAEHKYLWPDFRQVKVADPLSRETIPWVEYMRRMAGAFSGVANDLQQNQLDNARKNFQAFSAMFKALPTNGCVNCHATPRTYFVDANMQGMVDQLGQALAKTPPDGKTVGDMSQAIGMESCLKCHMVHVPSVQTKQRLEMFADLIK